MMNYLESLGIRSKRASEVLAHLDPASKNLGLRAAAEALKNNSKDIIEANNIDVNNAMAKGVSEALVDRLMLNKERIDQMAEGMIQVAELKDPVGEVLDIMVRPNGLHIEKVAVPMGVIGIPSERDCRCVFSLLQIR